MSRCPDDMTGLRTFQCVLDAGHTGRCVPYRPPTVDQWLAIEHQCRRLRGQMGLVRSLTRVAIALLLFILAAVGVAILAGEAGAAPVGTWTREDGAVVQVPCPSLEAQADVASVIRLPAGCVSLYPRIGYTVTQDLKLRGEVASLRAAAPLLRDEIAASRAAADALQADLTRRLAATRTEADVERATRQDLEVRLDLEAGRTKALEGERWTFAWVGGLTGVVLGAIIVGAIWASD